GLSARRTGTWRAGPAAEDRRRKGRSPVRRSLIPRDSETDSAGWRLPTLGQLDKSVAYNVNVSIIARIRFLVEAFWTSDHHGASALFTISDVSADSPWASRSEERRVGKEGRAPWVPEQSKKKRRKHV